MHGLPMPAPSDADNDDLPASGDLDGPGRGEIPPGHRSRLAAALDAHLAASPHVLSHGPDPRVERTAGALGLAALGVVVRRASLGGIGLAVVAVPTPVWADRRRRADALALKPLGRHLGRRVVLVQERALVSQPRLANARLVARCAEADLGPGDLFAVVGSLIDLPGAPLGDLAGLVAAPGGDPVEAVLSLVAQGLVEVDMSRPIGPATPAWLHAGRSRHV